MTGGKKTAEVLVVDDESQIRTMLRGFLEPEGYQVREADTGRSAVGDVVLRPPDAIILDLGLPDMSGNEVLLALRPICAVPVMILSVFGHEDSKTAALDAGADDYLTKPFAGKELLARLRALLRRFGQSASVTHFTFGPIHIDFTQRKVTRDGRRINLTVTEYEILRLLVTNRDKVLTHRQMLREVWGQKAEDQTHYLRTYMTRLRQRLGEDVAAAGYFETESRIGYRFVSEPAPHR